MRLCAASRPVNMRPLSSSVCPGFHDATFFRQRVEVDTCAPVVVRLPVHIGPQVERWRFDVGGPEPSKQFGIIATGLPAACVGYILILTSSTVVRPNPVRRCRAHSPCRAARPAAPGPRPLLQVEHVDVVHQRFLREQHRLFCGAANTDPQHSRWAPTGTIVGTVFSTQSTIESLGLSITNLLLFSEPPPFAATVTSTLSPATS